MLLEGQTEEAFVKATLAPHLEKHGVYAIPTVVWTNRWPSGGGQRGGVANWSQIHRDLRELTKDGNAWVTSMLDFYGLPKDFPGQNEIRDTNDAYKNVELLETRFAEALGNERERFIPFITLFEFEALVFSSPVAVASHFGSNKLEGALRSIVEEAKSPELINSGENTHPKMRLMRLLKEHNDAYDWAIDGPTILHKTGIQAIRNACPHFNAWITRLESLEAAPQ